MVTNGTLTPTALEALEVDPRVGEQYSAFRTCDAAFAAMLAVAQPRQSGEETDDGKPAANPKALYTKYLHCVGSAVCEPALQSWYSCLREARDKKRAFDSCRMTKRLVERCIRGRTEELLRASQPDVFRPTV